MREDATSVEIEPSIIQLGVRTLVWPLEPNTTGWQLSYQRPETEPEPQLAPAAPAAAACSKTTLCLLCCLVTHFTTTSPVAHDTNKPSEDRLLLLTPASINPLTGIHTPDAGWNQGYKTI